MSYPIPDLGQRPPLHAVLDEPGQRPPLNAELDEPGSPTHPHAELDEPGPQTHPRAEFDGRPFEAVGLLGLIPPPAQPGEPDRLRDRKLDSAIADRAAREAYAEWVVGSVCHA